MLDALRTLLSPERVLTEEPMARHTTFKIGGPAEFYVIPGEEEVEKIIDLCKRSGTPLAIIGNGSNLLVGDGGIRGVVMEIGAGMRRISVEKNTEGARRRIVVQAGAPLSRLSQEAAAANLTGLEFASGIPGTVGGALVMNAGAYGGEVKDVVEEIRVITSEGEMANLSAEAYDGGYRTSRVMREKMVVLSAVFRLPLGHADEIAQTMDDLRKRRNEKQPLNFPSAGSTFKRPEGYFAGKLIEDSGLAGYRVGDAEVSEKHCGFVINRGKATARDVRKLIEDVSLKVFETYGVKLEPEVRFMGDF